MAQCIFVELPVFKRLNPKNSLNFSPFMAEGYVYLDWQNIQVNELFASNKDTFLSMIWDEIG